MSRDHLLPSPLHKLHHDYVTPYVAILTSGGIMAGSILLFDVEKLAKLASAFMLMIYMTESVAVIVLRELRVQWYKPAFRSPMYPWMQLFGIASGIGLLVSMGLFSVFAGIGVALPGVLLFLAYSRRRTEYRGVVGMQGKRQDLLQKFGEGPHIEPADLKEDAAVVVALLGNERSPEMLVELGAALIDGGKVEVVHLTDVPEQTLLDAVAEDEPAVVALQRRIQAMAESQSITIDFLPIASHDRLETIHEITSRLHCQWLVMEYSGRTRSAFTVRNPLGWLQEHIAANLAIFNDAGVRYIRKILVHAVPGSHDSLVTSTADHLARIHGAELTVVRFVPDQSTVEQLDAAEAYVQNLAQMCEAKADTRIVRGRKEAVAIGRVGAAFDLLVTAEAGRTQFFKAVLGTLSDRLTEEAPCSVLRVQSPRGQAHEAFERQMQRTQQTAPSFLTYLEPRCVHPRLETTKKEALFHRFAASFAEILPDVSSDQILHGLWEREREQNTAVGTGIAIPHASLPSLNRTYLGVFTTQNPVAYEAPDGTGVDLFFVTIGTPADRQAHLVVLSSISKIVIKTDVAAQLRDAQNATVIIDALTHSARRLNEETIPPPP